MTDQTSELNTLYRERNELRADVERLEQDAKRIDFGWKGELAMLRDQNERDAEEGGKLRDKLLEIARGNCGSFQHDIPTFLAGLAAVTEERHE